MKNIIFVDDEPNVLDGLKRMLRSMRKEWDMFFAGGGQEALQIMETKPFDVIISDMRMPGMDGAELLNQVTRRYPNTVRIILSGQSDKESIYKAIGKTHQYLSKPCDADSLKQIVARACGLRDLLTDQKVRTIASSMNKMPSIPEIYIELVEELKEESPSMQMVSRLIAKDVAMTAKILQIVNSAFFGIRRRVTTVQMAVNFLGLENVSSLVLAANIFGQLKTTKNIKGFSFETLWNHCGQVGRYAQIIAKEENKTKEVIDDAMTAGLLHDCGKLIFATNVPAEYEKVLSLCKNDSLSIEKAEEEILGTNHAVLGAYVLGVWGLPDDIVEAVAFHHNPMASHVYNFTPLSAVYAADSIAGCLSGENKMHSVNLEYLQVINMSDRYEQWSLKIESE